MNVYLNELGEPVGGEEWEAEVQTKLNGIKSELEEELGFEVVVSDKNIGSGADWIVIAISLAGHGFFLIPKAHKYVREAIEEWGIIFDNLWKLRRLLGDNYSVTMHSPGYSLIDAIGRLEERNELAEAVFLDHSTLPRRDFMPVVNKAESADQVFVIGVSRGIRIFIYDHVGQLLSERIIDFRDEQDA